MRYRRLKNLLSILERNTRVYWPAIFQCLKQDDCTSPSFGFLSYCAITFLDKLLAIGCSDANTVEKILKLYGFYCASKHHFLSSEELSIEFYGDIQSIFHNDRICNCGLKDNVTYFNVDLLEIAMRANDLKFMTGLVKYGYIPYNASCTKWSRTTAQLYDFWMRWLVPVGVPLTEFLAVRENVRNMINGKKEGYRRFRLIIQMVGILDIKWCWRRERIEDHYLAKYPVYTDRQFFDCVQCMKLYFRATSEPFISEDELVKFISSNSIWDGVPEDFLASAALDYKDLFPQESNASYTPRTLNHLCRYSLRKSLTEKKVGVLPELVENLCLPKRLKSYLRCEY